MQYGLNTVYPKIDQYKISVAGPGSRHCPVTIAHLCVGVFCSYIRLSNIFLKSEAISFVAFFISRISSRSALSCAKLFLTEFLTTLVNLFIQDFVVEKKLGTILNSAEKLIKIIFEKISGLKPYVAP